MSRLEDLPPDLRAVLSLLLRQRKAYLEIAALLGIQERAVRDRAHAALAMIAPRQARALTVEQRSRVGDYLLGQLAEPEHTQTAGELAGSSAAREWALALSSELAPLAAVPLPEIPGAPRRANPAARLPSSRAGGALLLGAIAVVVVVAVVLIAGNSGGGSGSPTKSVASTTTSTSSTPSSSQSSTQSSGTATSTSTSSTATPKEESHSTLTSTVPGSKATGSVLVLSESGKRAFYLQVTGLAAAPSGSVYAVWLTGTGVKAEAVGVLPAANSAGRIEGGALLPGNATSYHRVIVTRETSQQPSHPSAALLSAPLSFGSSH